MWLFFRHPNCKKKYLFLIYYGTSGKNINFDGEKIKKSNFCKNKRLFNICDIDVSKILVSKKRILR